MFRTGESSSTNDEGPTYYVGVYPSRDKVVFGTMDDGWSAKHTAYSVALQYDEIYTLSVVADGDVYTVYVDEVAIFEDITRTEFGSGSIGLRTYYAPATYHSLTYSDTGCDAASFIAQDCPVGANCLLDNGRWSGSCCTTDFQCLEGEGDCDSDNDCAGALVCGRNNCGDPFQDTHDCCTPVAEGPTGCDADSFESQCPELKENCDLDNGRRSGSCCTSEFQCLAGEGDCDSDSDCADGLVCGTNNCDDVFQDTHDCCEVSASASIAASGGAAVAVEDGSGADEANPDGNTTVIWMEAVFGAVIAVVLIYAAVLVAVSMAKRRKSA